MLSRWPTSPWVFFTLVSFAALGNCFTPTGMYDLSPGELDQLCKTVDSSFQPMADSQPCVYMKWISCPSGGTKTQPCGWYQQTMCDGGKRKKRNKIGDSLRPRRFNTKDPAVVKISWPEGAAK